MNRKQLIAALKAANVEFSAKADKATLEAALNAVNATARLEEVAPTTEATEVAAEGTTPEVTAEVAAEVAAKTKEQRRLEGHKKQSVSQRETMQIADRRIVNTETGEAYKNCSAIWKLDLISSSQCDTLSGKIFAAYKKDRSTPVVEIAGRKWQMAEGFEGEIEGGDEE